jgi:hypothetical protein
MSVLHLRPRGLRLGRTRGERPGPRPGLQLRPLLGSLALGLAALAVVAGPAGATGKHHDQRLVVRGDATAVDGPCDASGCPLELTDGRFRGAPIGTGNYSAAFKVKVADAFPNGEGGICAPIKGRIVLGAGSADRLVLAVAGDSCQDGSGPLEGASFTGLASYTVRYGTGKYAGANGSGLASFAEDAAKHHRMTLVGRIAL